MTESVPSRGSYALFAGLLLVVVLILAGSVTAIWYRTSQRTILESPHSGVAIAEETARATAWVRLKEDNGELKGIELRPRGEATFRPVTDARSGTDAALTALESRLKELRPLDLGRETMVMIEADPGLLQKHLIRVYDVCKAAGYGQITFTPTATRLRGLR